MQYEQHLQIWTSAHGLVICSPIILQQDKDLGGNMILELSHSRFYQVSGGVFRPLKNNLPVELEKY